MNRSTKWVVNIFASVVVAISVVGFIPSLGFVSNTVYAQPSGDQLENIGANPDEESDNGDELSCAIAKMGWILCPLIETSGEIGDRAFQLLAKTFLETEPELVAVNGAGNSYSGTYQSWELARNIANVMFIIAFLIIILSQVTGRGLDNYGIKKTLPRLIIAAIAVNVSFFICQVMVDLSNILGYEIQNFLVDMARTVSDRTAMPVASDIDLHTGGEGLGSGTLAVIAAAVLATVAIVWLILPLLIAGIGTIVITAIIVVIILLLRKAFIVLLVVVSPVAFVLYLLPNTEQYFRKWLSMFWKLLMVFPVIGLLFGAGQLASAVVLVAGTNTGASESASDNTYYDGSDKCITLPSSAKDATNNEAKVGSCGTSSTPLMLGLIAAGIAVAPLLAVWSVLKSAISGAGTIGGKISGTVETYTGKGVDRLGKGPGARLSKRAGILANKSRVANIATAGVYRGRSKKKAIDGGLDKELNRAEVDYTSAKAKNSEKFQRQLAGGRLAGSDGQQRAEANAISQQRSLEDENKKAAHTTVDLLTPDQLVSIDSNGNATGQLIDAIKDKKTVDSAQTAAMIERAIQAGTAKQKEAIIDSLRDTKFGLATRTASDALAQNNPGYIGAGQLDAIRLGKQEGQSQPSYKDMSLNSIRAGKFTPEKMASADRYDAEYAHAISQGDSGAVRALGQAAQEALSNEKIRGAIKDNRDAIVAMSAGYSGSSQAPPTPPTTP